MRCCNNTLLVAASLIFCLLPCFASHTHTHTHDKKNIVAFLPQAEEFREMLIRMCGNKMPTRCNKGFYCRSYCLLNMFRAPLCPSSGAQEYYTLVAACGISCSTPDQQLENRSTKYHRQQPLYNTLKLLMMGIVVPETC